MIKKIIKGLFAGFMIGMAGAAFVIAKSQSFLVVPALLFPVGLFLICLFGFDLYTGKIGYLFDEKKGIKVVDLAVMLAANACGAILFGAIFTLVFKDNAAVSSCATAVAESKFGTLDISSALFTLIKSTLCGMLVYIGVYLFARADSLCSKAIAIWVPIATFVYLGFDHSIANIFYLSAMNSYCFKGVALILVAVVGNSIGAIVFDRALAFIAR